MARGSTLLLPAAHGRRRELGALTSSDSPPVDELRPATPADTDRSERTADGRFAKGNRVAKAKRLRAGPRGSLRALEAKGDPAHATAARWGRRWAAHRRGELARAHGGEISSDVGLMVEAAGELWGDALYWQAKGRETSNPELAKLAASLFAQARGMGRDAWQMAALEAAARPRGPSATPWLVPEGSKP